LTVAVQGVKKQQQIEFIGFSSRRLC